MACVNSFVYFCVLVAGALQLQPVSAGDAKEYAHRIFRRQTTCDQRFLDNYNTSHSACLPPSSTLVASGVSAADKTVIVDRHNLHRGDVSPTATDMLKMSWDDEIAKIAQGWASNCQVAHDAHGARKDYERYEYLGQNLAWATGSYSWTQAIDAWNNEKVFYDYTINNTTDEDEAIGHYTQVVWAKSFKIGCGYAECGTTKYYVCNYGPGGNYIGELPYTAGPSYADCPNTHSGNLCDCGTMDCYSDGKRDLDISDCSCNCRYNLVAPDCTVDCDSVNEPSYCTTWQYSCQWGYQYSCAFHCGICEA